MYLFTGVLSLVSSDLKDRVVRYIPALPSTLPVSSVMTYSLRVQFVFSKHHVKKKKSYISVANSKKDWE